MRQERRITRASLASNEAKLKRDPHDDGTRDRVETLRAQYRALALEDHIREAVAQAPPLTNEQREKLALLLRGSAA